MKYILAALAAWGLGLSAGAPALAHEGHDHAEAAAAMAASPPAIARLAPRLEARSDAFELVAALDGGHLVVWLDRWADNAPVTDATVEVDSPSLKGALTPRADGSYARPAALPPGEHALVFSITTKNDGDLLNGVLRLPAPTPDALALPMPLRWSLGAIALLVLAGLAFFLTRRRT